MCLMLSAPKALIRAQSDEHLRSPVAEGNRKAPLSARESTTEHEAAELARCQQTLERACQEKRALEMLVQQLRKQLTHLAESGKVCVCWFRFGEGLKFREFSTSKVKCALQESGLIDNEFFVL
ncbi:unnamed protein product [Nippostrongylus brasiliensis]|uniref:UBX domain-containing protein n=1 Tax=Nippostrongylus brasiliensis TaxID=27835 RepID=A0A0N4YD46_NIPBR|nr:unnamed protein product [Nippostrongylus brasiliensis]